MKNAAQKTLEYLNALMHQAAHGQTEECCERPGIRHVLSGQEELDKKKAEARAAVKETTPASVSEHLALERLRLFLEPRTRQTEETFEQALFVVMKVLAPEVKRDRTCAAAWLRSQAGV